MNLSQTAGFLPRLCHLLAMGFWPSYWLSVPQCPQLKNEDNNGTHVMVVL